MAKDPNFTMGQRILLAVGPYAFMAAIAATCGYSEHWPRGLWLWVFGLLTGTWLFSLLGEWIIARWRRRKTARDGGSAAQQSAAKDAPRPSSRP